MKTLNSLFIICLVTIALLLSSCQSTGLKIGGFDVGRIVKQGVKVFNASNIDEEQEVQFGSNMSAILLGTRPLHKNKAINSYVNQVGTWLAANSARPELPWRFGVIDTTAINAFAAPGGFVFITSGMLMQLDNEAQLAAVLAHEIIHVTEQHYFTAIKDEAFKSTITETIFVSAEAYQEKNNSSEESKRYRRWADEVTGMAQAIYIKGLDKEDELQADSLGMRLLAKSGYDPFAAIDNLQIIGAIAADDAALALLYQTHPTPEQRLDALAAQIDKLATSDGLLLRERFVNMVH